ncbi:MAG: D-alanine-D-alanine ligase [Parcubacteria group bacterium Gr01-1014_20]|nr:MAG: D-alanine-D-alanine ligase [Parcubacteria group bacterium Gr01-1014_20]
MKKNKIRVGILFGGKSAEHEVSLQSAKNVVDAIDKEKYEVVLIGIDKFGKWLLPNKAQFLLNASDPKLIKLNKENVESVALVPQSGGELTNLSSEGTVAGVDVVFPILHGPFGEDGTVQGLLKLAGVPFVGAGVLGSAVGMDKDVMKRLLRDAGLPIANFLVFKQGDNLDFEEVSIKLGLPFFVKPANLGSSVGISKVRNREDFRKAIDEAFQYDIKIVIEEFVDGRELECAVLGNEKPMASGVGEIIPNHEFYSYEAKYVDENGARLEVPAKIPSEINERVHELAVKSFRVLECEGLGRVDFFLKKDGDLVVSEINTIPGFTKISMYPRLWEASGVSYTELISSLIELAIERFQREQKLRFSNG